MMRRTIAPRTPHRMPWRRSLSGRLRQASAMTTALSPDSRMLIRMISNTESRNCGVNSSAMFFSLLSLSSLQNADQQFAHLGRVARDLDAACFHHRKFFLSGPLAAGDDCAGVPHPLPLRRGAADLADHDHRFGVGIVVEQPQHIEMLQSVDRIAADADSRRLAETQLGD